MNSYHNHGIPFVSGTVSVEIICDFFFFISEDAPLSLDQIIQMHKPKLDIIRK
jgi:hypothetical protein